MKLLSLNTIEGFSHRLKVSNLGSSVATEFIQYPLTVTSNGDLIGDGYEQAEKYGIARVVSYSGEDIELKFFEANLSPFPSQDMDIDWFVDSNDAKRKWGISICGTYSFSQSERSESNMVCFKLKRPERDKRVSEKQKKGFVLARAGRYRAADRTFN